MKNKIVIMVCATTVLVGIAFGGSKVTHDIGDVTSSTQLQEKVVINTATEAQLETLKGLSVKKAKAIASYRKEHGAFDSLDDLTEVSGIGDKLLDNLKEDNPGLSLN